MHLTLPPKASARFSDAPAKKGRLLLIDAPSTRDVEDAIALVKDGDGWRATVVIANAAAHVRIGSTDEATARRHGATIYHGQRAAQTMPKRSTADRVRVRRKGENRHLSRPRRSFAPMIGIGPSSGMHGGDRPCR